MPTLNNKDKREIKELINVFADPKSSRQAWRSVGQAILNNPASCAPMQYDKDGNPTFASDIENYTYNKLRNDLKKLGEPNREPTELEMIMACQIVKARFDTQAAVFVRDTLGAKPIDESKMDANLTSNPYEQMTDEELELLAEHRAKKAAEAEAANIDDQTQGSDSAASESLVNEEEHDA